MYNANQFAEFNKVNVAQASKIAAIAMDNAEKLMKLNLATVKAALAQGVEGASAAAWVEGRPGILHAAAQVRRDGRREQSSAYSRGLYEVVSEAQAQYSAIAEEAVAGYTQGPRVVGREGRASRPRPARTSRSTR